MSRELVQLEDLLNWAESVHGNSHDDVKEAIRVKNEANKVLKVQRVYARFFCNYRVTLYMLFSTIAGNSVGVNDTHW